MPLAKLFMHALNNLPRSWRPTAPMIYSEIPSATIAWTVFLFDQFIDCATEVHTVPPITCRKVLRRSDSRARRAICIQSEVDVCTRVWFPSDLWAHASNLYRIKRPLSRIGPDWWHLRLLLSLSPVLLHVNKIVTQSTLWSYCQCPS